jgi:endoglucanase
LVTLRGVNRSGLEYSPTEAPDAGEIATIVQGWGANIIRLPFNQEWALTRPGYLETIDFCIDTAAALGAYTLLDLHWLDATTVRGHDNLGRPNFVSPLPNEESEQMWSRMARRYRDRPHVLYDIFNEPHDPLPGDPLASGRVTMAEWQPWAVRLIDAIRTQNPSAVVVVPGVNWGYDLEGFPIPGVAGVVYSTHVYPNKGADWDRAFGNLAATHPVFASEWGGEDQDVAWGRTLAAYFERRGIGWTAWCWKNWPHLIRKPAPPYAPTPFGELVRELLRVG